MPEPTSGHAAERGTSGSPDHLITTATLVTRIPPTRDAGADLGAGADLDPGAELGARDDLSVGADLGAGVELGAGTELAIRLRERAAAVPRRYPADPRPADGAPDVVIIVLDDIVLDDLGFAQLGAFGSDIATPAVDAPAVDALAADGLRYNRFHVTALCSPTRAVLLTGRNHHSVGMGS